MRRLLVGFIGFGLLLSPSFGQDNSKDNKDRKEAPTGTPQKQSKKKKGVNGTNTADPHHEGGDQSHDPANKQDNTKKKQ